MSIFYYKCVKEIKSISSSSENKYPSNLEAEQALLGSILVNKKKDELNRENLETKNKFKEIAVLINNKTFTFSKESKDNGDLYGSIKPKEITNLIKEKTNADVSPSQIILKEELNKIGSYKVDINFHAEVKANISLKISKIQTK